MVLSTLITIIDWGGIVVFAITGALVASRKEMDIFGFMLLGAVTGIGGGTLRDLLLGRTPVFWVLEPALLVVCLVAAAAVFFLAPLVGSRYRLLLWLDALGLALFAIVGAEIALAAGHGPVVAVVMGVVTATFGGIIRDVLGGESPVVLRREIYVTAAALGAITFVALTGLGLPRDAALIASFIAAFGLRAIAILRGWSLPRYQSRPGRRPDEIGL